MNPIYFRNVQNQTIFTLSIKCIDMEWFFLSSLIQLFLQISCVKYSGHWIGRLIKVSDLNYNFILTKQKFTLQKQNLLILWLTLHFFLFLRLTNINENKRKHLEIIQNKNRLQESRCCNHIVIFSIYLLKRNLKTKINCLVLLGIMCNNTNRRKLRSGKKTC